MFLIVWLLALQPAFHSVHLNQHDHPGTAPKKIVEWATPQEHDFGEIRRERPVYYAFKFKNLLDEPILLQTVRTTCGCTAASWTETPIPPGGEGEVRIEYDAYTPGDFSKKIRVFFDKQRKPEILRISGTVLNR